MKKLLRPVFLACTGISLFFIIQYRLPSEHVDTGSLMDIETAAGNVHSSVTEKKSNLPMSM